MARFNDHFIKIDKSIPDMRLIFMSDIHDGLSNDDAKKIDEKNADIVVIGGDIIRSNNEGHDELYEALSRIHAPKYVIKGNHETMIRENDHWVQHDHKGFIRDIQKVPNLTLMVNNMVPLVIGGDLTLLTHNMPFEWYEAEHESQVSFRKSVNRSYIGGINENTAVMFATHSPSGLVRNGHIINNGTIGVVKYVDLMCCGHTHGGVISLPNHHGLIDINGNLGIHPDVHGVYEEDGKTLIISKGFTKIPTSAGALVGPILPKDVEVITLSKRFK